MIPDNFFFELFLLPVLNSNNSHKFIFRRVLQRKATRIYHCGTRMTTPNPMTSTTKAMPHCLTCQTLSLRSIMRLSCLHDHSTNKSRRHKLSSQCTTESLFETYQCIFLGPETVKLGQSRIFITSSLFSFCSFAF